MRNRTNIKVVSFFDGTADKTDAFADIIAFKYAEKRRKSVEKRNEKTYNRDEVQEYDDPRSRLCG